MKQERERFYNSELPYLLTDKAGHTLLGGDFNCIPETTICRWPQLQPGISGIGARPSFDRHMARRPRVQG